MLSRLCLCLLVVHQTSGFQPVSFIAKPAMARTSVLFAEREPFLISKKQEGLFDNFYSSGFWEGLAETFMPKGYRSNIDEMKTFVQIVSVLRVCVPSFLIAALAAKTYPGLSMMVSGWIDDPKAMEVVANDYAQYIQNILTTSGLMFSITVGYTYYFLYQQQEAIYVSLFEEVTQAKCLLEQISLISQGRSEMYQDILDCIERYVEEDLTQFFVEPSVLLSRRPIDDPLEEIMFLTSVGEPGVVYQTVRTLRQARAFRLGALQRKLPPIHFALVYTLAAVVMVVFPLLGAGSQTLGGDAILQVQAVFLSFIVFGICAVLGVLNELNQPTKNGAYNVVPVLNIMVKGLVDEINARQDGQFITSQFTPSTMDGLNSVMDYPSDDTLEY
mmetsp:Transcript_32022/g.52920  ORF Transcript_32022/g.52920 Transcript_32022/m.52920 type:complete len:386 (-) Transcript_32022:47-1204(-)